MLNRKTYRFIKNWEEVLINLGYKLERNGEKIRTQAIWRGGTGNSISIDPIEQTFKDYKSGEHGSLHRLIQLTTGADDVEVQTALEYVEKDPKKDIRKLFEIPRTYSEDSIKSFVYDYSYFEKRGISKNVQKMYEAGMIYKEKFAFRMVFGVRDYFRKGNLIGFAGRYTQPLTNDSTPKWLIIGPKRFFIYNYKLCVPAIKKDDKIILVESIGDSLSFAQSGIFNTLVLFGTEVSKSIKLFLLSQNPKRIIISTNNDDNGAGQIGSSKIYSALSKIFSTEKISINLPSEVGDWNDVLLKHGEEHIRSFYKNI